MTVAQNGIWGRFVGLLRYKIGRRKNQEAVFAAAESWLGTDASPDDIAPDELGCAESVSNIINKVVNFPLTVSTRTLYKYLANDDRFVKLTGTPKRGAIVISPTGSGNGTVVGHCGIVGDDGSIMANDSNTGEWRYYYTTRTWRERWADKGGMPVYYFGLL